MDADELTYTMHIIIRFEIEREVISGEVSVENLPKRWNEKMREYLGITSPDDAKGVLQDIHWSMGSIGYFPTYTLGSMISAQLYTAAKRDIPDLESQIEQGRFEDLRNWLHEKVWKHGKRYQTKELVEKATGRPLSPDDYIDYLEKKFTS